MSTHAIDRRTVVSAMAAGAAATALGATAFGESVNAGGKPTTAMDTPDNEPPRGRRERPVSMAMHIHGPFSEGVGSYEAHLAQARRTGVDVIWWTDHDFRVAAHDHRRAVHFDGPKELEGTLEWSWAEKTEGTLADRSAAFVDTGSSTEDPPTALRLSATGGGTDGGILWYAGTAWNYTYSTCVADTTLELDVLPEQLDPGAAVLLQFDLSYHPARGGLPTGQYVLRYRFADLPERTHRANGLLGTVEVPVGTGSRKRLRLDPVADAKLLWPDLVAEDNSVRNLRVGVAVPAGASASTLVDRLYFHRERQAGQAGDELRADVLARYRDEYADVAHYRSYEVSLVRHLNWYGGDLTMPYFPSPPLRDNDPALAASMVEFLHAHGGIVCWNHPMDVETRESLATLMIERNALGADLVEIGRDPMMDLLWVLDVAARNAIFFTAVGSSDDHGGKDWLKQEEPWVTYAWATSTDEDDLVDALRRGRAWFCDPRAFRGHLDLRVPGRGGMGAALLTRAPVVPVEITATDLPADSTLEVIIGTVDRAGIADPVPATEVRTLRPVLFAPGPFVLPVAPLCGRYVRTQVRASDGTVVGVSNPLWLLRDEPPAGMPAARRAVPPAGT